MKKLLSLSVLIILIFTTSCAQESVKATRMTQSELQEKLKPFFETLDAIPEDEHEMEAVKKAALDFIDQNHNDAGVYVVRSVLGYAMDPTEIIALVDANDFLSQDSTIIEARKVWEVQIATGEGKPFADFSAEYEGKVTKLSDYVGKGKYVLVDFWASWCGPCKREIPNLISVYEKFKGDRFEVLGVATWDKPEDTKKSIEQLGIPYPQILNAQKKGSDAYGIMGIPQIILFGPDGTILKRNLRGEQIATVVAEYLNK